MRKPRRKKRIARQIVMWALITKGLMWVFGGGFDSISKFLRQVQALFMKTEEEKKEENGKRVDDEFRGNEKDERPKWDV